MGYQPEEDFLEEQLSLKMGDKLFFYTDGLIENQNPLGEVWREKNLIRLLEKHHQCPIKQIMSLLVQEIYLFWDTCPIEDDVTAIACQIIQPFSGSAKIKP